MTASIHATSVIRNIILQAEYLKGRMIMRGFPSPVRIVVYLGRNQRHALYKEVASFSGGFHMGSISGPQEVVIYGHRVVWVEEQDHFNVTAVNP